MPVRGSRQTTSSPSPFHDAVFRDLAEKDRDWGRQRSRIAPGSRGSPPWAGVGDVLVFLIPCVINGAMLIYFLTGFRSHVGTEDRAGESDAELPSRLPTPCEGRSHASEDLVTESADG